MSWVSSLHYYKWLNELAQKELGPINSSKIILSSVNWAQIKHFQQNNLWDEAGEYLADQAQKLEQIGAELIIIGTNTMHKVASDVEAATSVPLIHIADATAAKIKKQGLNKIALLGTTFTMVEDFYKERLEAQGIEVLIPDENDVRVVNNIIFDELCQNITTEASKAEYIRISNEMFDRGAQGLIMGCTEITTLIGQDDFDKPVFDTTSIHVEEAFKAASGES